MIDFHSDIEKANGCFNRYKLGAFFVASAVALVALANVISNYQKYHYVFFTTFFSMIALALFIGVLYSVYRGAVLMNKSVKNLQITTETIIFQTFTATMFLGLVRKKSLNVEIPRKLAEFKLAPIKYGFNKKYTGDVYLLSYAGDDYLIESNFFENFSELKGNLVSNTV